MERKFRRYIEHKIHQPTESEESSISDSDVEILDSRKFVRNFRRLYGRSSIKEREKLRKQWEEIRRIRLEIIEDPQKKISQLLDFFNDITKETEQLIEVKDIIDELKTMVEIQKKQKEVFEKFHNVLSPGLMKGEGRPTRVEQSMREAVVRQMTPFATKFSYQCSEIEALAEKAENTHKVVRNS
jgi:hypothetical protein